MKITRDMVDSPPAERDLAAEALMPVARDLEYFRRPKGADGKEESRRGVSSQQRALFGALGGGVAGYSIFRGLAGAARVEGVAGFGESVPPVRGLPMGGRMGITSRYSLGHIGSVMLGAAVATTLLCAPPRPRN